jgi:hypothetical protein
MTTRKKTNVYVDGFNFYYGCIKGTPCRWLDLRKFCEAMFPKNEINRIRYFTAIVQQRPGDPTQPQRQAAYLRALQTLPGLTVHCGQFLTQTVHRPLAIALPGYPPNWVGKTPGGPSRAWVIKTEEKGSDVNLATYLLCDGFDSDYEVAIVVSNDSDLATPIRVARARFKLDVIVLNPCAKPSAELSRVATFVRGVRKHALQSSQFPPELEDTHGKITKPAGW